MLGRLPCPPYSCRPERSERTRFKDWLAFPLHRCQDDDGSEPKAKRARRDPATRVFYCIGTPEKRFGQRGWYIWAYDLNDNHLYLLVMWTPPPLHSKVHVDPQVAMSQEAEGKHTVVLGRRDIALLEIGECNVKPPPPDVVPLYRLPLLGASVHRASAAYAKGMFYGVFPRPISRQWAIASEDPAELLREATRRSSPFLLRPSYSVFPTAWTDQCGFAALGSWKETQQWAMATLVHRRNPETNNGFAGRWGTSRCTPCWKEFRALPVQYHPTHRVFVLCFARRVDRRVTRRFVRDLVRLYRTKEIQLLPDCHWWSWDRCAAFRPTARITVLEALRFPVPPAALVGSPWPFGRVLAHHQSEWQLYRATDVVPPPPAPPAPIVKRSYHDCLLDIQHTMLGSNSGTKFTPRTFVSSRVLFTSLSPRASEEVLEEWEMTERARHVAVVASWEALQRVANLDWLFVVSWARAPPMFRLWEFIQDKAQTIVWYVIQSS